MLVISSCVCMADVCVNDKEVVLGKENTDTVTENSPLDLLQDTFEDSALVQIGESKASPCCKVSLNSCCLRRLISLLFPSFDFFVQMAALFVKRQILLLHAITRLLVQPIVSALIRINRFPMMICRIAEGAVKSNHSSKANVVQ